MAWKDLFLVNEEENQQTKTDVKSSKVSEKTSVSDKLGTQFPQSQFPTFTQNSGFPSTANQGSVFSPNQPNNQGGGSSFSEKNHTSTFPDKNPFIDKIMDVYDKGFCGLNQQGYDFFEFFKAVCTAGIDNSQVYQMALEMGKAMDGNVSKQSLLSQADFYLDELNKVYVSFSSDGQNKIAELSQRKNSESTSLSSDIASLKIQLSNIQDKIKNKEADLNDIDNKYQPQIAEITLKLTANDTVKNIFIGNINKVKTNITNNLK